MVYGPAWIWMVRQRRVVLTNLRMDQPGLALDTAADRERREDDGQVGFDGQPASREAMTGGARQPQPCQAQVKLALSRGQPLPRSRPSAAPVPRHREPGRCARSPAIARCQEYTICTAVAADAVFSVRTYGTRQLCHPGCYPGGERKAAPAATARSSTGRRWISRSERTEPLSAWLGTSPPG
jgi:hypothetical protein